MTERRKYLRVTPEEKQTIREAVISEFGTEPGSGIATGTAVAYLCEKAIEEESG